MLTGLEINCVMICVHPVMLTGLEINCVVIYVHPVMLTGLEIQRVIDKINNHRNRFVLHRFILMHDNLSLGRL